MKRPLGLIVLVVILLGIVAFVLSASVTSANPTIFGRPTPAPSPVPNATPELAPTTIPLEHPLTTSYEALRHVLTIDANIANWSEPWSETTLEQDPGRIAIQQFASRTEESRDANRGEFFAPEVDADAGQVWRVSITGDVRLRLISMEAESGDVIYQGATYVISARTGALLSVISGPPKDPS